MTTLAAQSGHYAIGPRDGSSEWHNGTSNRRDCSLCVTIAPDADRLRKAAQTILDCCLDFFDEDDLDPESSFAMPVVLKARDVFALRAALAPSPKDAQSEPKFGLAPDAARLDVERQRLIAAAIRYYADTMPGYAAAAGLSQDEYAAVMVDVKRARALAAEDRP